MVVLQVTFWIVFTKKTKQTPNPYNLPQITLMNLQRIIFKFFLVVIFSYFVHNIFVHSVIFTNIVFFEQYENIKKYI